MDISVSGVNIAENDDEAIVAVYSLYGVVEGSADGGVRTAMAVTDPVVHVVKATGKAVKVVVKQAQSRSLPPRWKKM